MHRARPTDVKGGPGERGVGGAHCHLGLSHLDGSARHHTPAFVEYVAHLIESGIGGGLQALRAIVATSPEIVAAGIVVGAHRHDGDKVTRMHRARPTDIEGGPGERGVGGRETNLGGDDLDRGAAQRCVARLGHVAQFVEPGIGGCDQGAAAAITHADIGAAGPVISAHGHDADVVARIVTDGCP